MLAMERCWSLFQEFMRSEGIDLNEPEGKLTDPYMESRRQPQYCYTTPSTYDKLRKFLELDRNVLRFYCVWDDRDNMFGEIKPFVSLSTIIYMHTCRNFLLEKLEQVVKVSLGENLQRIHVHPMKFLMCIGHPLLPGGWYGWNTWSAWAKWWQGPIPSPPLSPETTQISQRCAMWVSSHAALSLCIDNKDTKFCLLLENLHAWQ